MFIYLIYDKNLSGLQHLSELKVTSQHYMKKLTDIVQTQKHKTKRL